MKSCPEPFWKAIVAVFDVPPNRKYPHKFQQYILIEAVLQQVSGDNNHLNMGGIYNTLPRNEDQYDAQVYLIFPAHQFPDLGKVI